jgi:hypothetical protein
MSGPGVQTETENGYRFPHLPRRSLIFRKETEEGIVPTAEFEPAGRQIQYPGRRRTILRETQFTREICANTLVLSFDPMVLLTAPVHISPTLSALAFQRLKYTLSGKSLMYAPFRQTSSCSSGQEIK